MEQERREFLKKSAILLSIAAGSDTLLLTPHAAWAAGVPYQVLSGDQVSTLEGLAEALVPGARDAGIAHYIDKQLGAAPQDTLLMLKYLGVPVADFPAFYHGGLAATAELSKSRFSRPWLSLDAGQADALVAAMAAGETDGWNGPPSAFFLFVVRSDACDVVYGTEDGFARIGMPYMAHIEPPRQW
jgi:hypothetical protein